MIRKYTQLWIDKGGKPKGVELSRDDLFIYFDDGVTDTSPNRNHRLPETPETRLITLTQAFARLGRGVVGLTKNSLGLDQAEKSLRTERLLICEQCEHSHPIEKAVESRACGKLFSVTVEGDEPIPTCGCWLEKKTRLASESCPLKKW